MNGDSDSAKIGAFIGAFKAELEEKASVSIVYDADAKTTTVVPPGGRATATACGRRGEEPPLDLLESGRGGLNRLDASM